LRDTLPHPIRLTLQCTVYLNYRYILLCIVILDLIRGAGTQVHLNVKVRDLRDIPYFVSTLKKF
jgi:hypothetical protein